jgi:tRNA(Phe) wybutosine-synthesizing methylase Tyw3
MEISLEKSVGGNSQEKKIDSIFDYIQSVTNNNFDRNNAYRIGKELEVFTKESYVDFLVELWSKSVEDSKKSIIENEAKINELKEDFVKGPVKVQQAKDGLKMHIDMGATHWFDMDTKLINDLEGWYSEDAILDRISKQQEYTKRYEENIKILEERLEKIEEIKK